MNPSENKFKARLVNSANPTDRVIFEVSPDISESRTVDYKNITPLHMPGSILVYANTAPRTFQISSSKLISDTQNAAYKNLTLIQQLRTWCMPRFGQQGKTVTGNQRASAEHTKLNQRDQISIQPETITTNATSMIGSPPPVLYFTAYSDHTKSGLQNITKIPVVIESLSFNFSNETDYILTITNVPFPIIMNVDLTLKETHSPREFERFNLDDFRNGNLRGF